MTSYSSLAFIVMLSYIIHWLIYNMFVILRVPKLDS